MRVNCFFISSIARDQIVKKVKTVIKNLFLLLLSFSLNISTANAEKNVLNSPNVKNFITFLQSLDSGCKRGTLIKLQQVDQKKKLEQISHSPKTFKFDDENPDVENYLKFWSTHNPTNNWKYHLYKKKKAAAKQALQANFKSVLDSDMNIAEQRAEDALMVIENSLIRSHLSQSLNFKSLLFTYISQRDLPSIKDLKEFISKKRTVKVMLNPNENYITELNGDIVDIDVQKNPYIEKTLKFNEEDIQTSIRYAILNNLSIDYIKLLLDISQVNLSIDMGEDDSLLSISVHRPNVVEYLINKGANVNYKNSFGKTPLMHAIQSHNLDSVDLLLKNGANVNSSTIKAKPFCEEYTVGTFSRSPLMYATWQGHVDIVKKLLAFGANINAIDSNGENALSYVSKNIPLNPQEKIEIIKLLSVNLKSK